MNIYSVDIYGRSNHILKSIAGEHLHSEIIVAKNKKTAMHYALTNLRAETFGTLWHDDFGRRDVKIDCERLTDEFVNSHTFYSDEVYWTNPVFTK